MIAPPGDSSSSYGARPEGSAALERFEVVVRHEKTGLTQRLSQVLSFRSSAPPWTPDRGQDDRLKKVKELFRRDEDEDREEDEK